MHLLLLTRKDFFLKKSTGICSRSIRNITLDSRPPTFSSHFTKGPDNRLSLTINILKLVTPSQSSAYLPREYFGMYLQGTIIINPVEVLGKLLPLSTKNYANYATNATLRGDRLQSGLVRKIALLTLRG